MAKENQQGNQPPAQVPAKPLDDLWSDYPEEKFNRLLPTQAFMKELGPHQKLSVRVVTLEGTENAETAKRSPDIYPQWTPNGTQYALSGRALDKVADAAGLVFHPLVTMVEERKRGYCRYKAVSVRKLPDGQVKLQTRMYEMDLEVERADLENSYRKKAVDKLKKAKAKGEQFDAQGWVDSCVERDLKAKEKFMLPLCESKAMNRCIRHDLSIAAHYPLAALQKPFAVPYVQFAPDTTDPSVMRMLLDRQAAAQTALFGGLAELVAPQGEQAGLPPGMAVEMPQETSEQAGPDEVGAEEPASETEPAPENDKSGAPAEVQGDPAAAAGDTEAAVEADSAGLDEALALPPQEPAAGVSGEAPPPDPREEWFAMRMPQVLGDYHTPQDLQGVMRDTIVSSKYPTGPDPAGAMKLWRDNEVENHFHLALVTLEWWVLEQERERQQQLPLGGEGGGGSEAAE